MFLSVLYNIQSFLHNTDTHKTACIAAMLGVCLRLV